MMQCVASALPINVRRSGAKGSDALAPLLGLPHVDSDVVKKLRKQRINTIKGEHRVFMFVGWVVRACCPTLTLF